MVNLTKVCACERREADLSHSSDAQQAGFRLFSILLCRALELGIKVKLLLLNRGFYSRDLIRYLGSYGIRYMMLIQKRNRGMRAGMDRTYTTMSPNMEMQVTFKLVTMEEKGKLLAFATNMCLKLKMIKFFRKR